VSDIAVVGSFGIAAVMLFCSIGIAFRWRRRTKNKLWALLFAVLAIGLVMSVPSGVYYDFLKEFARAIR
jgi:hypothetical protein